MRVTPLFSIFNQRIFKSRVLCRTGNSMPLFKFPELFDIDVSSALFAIKGA